MSDLGENPTLRDPSWLEAIKRRLAQYDRDMTNHNLAGRVEYPQAANDVAILVAEYDELRARELVVPSPQPAAGVVRIERGDPRYCPIDVEHLPHRFIYAYGPDGVVRGWYDCDGFPIWPRAAVSSLTPNETDQT